MSFYSFTRGCFFLVGVISVGFSSAKTQLTISHAMADRQTLRAKTLKTRCGTVPFRLRLSGPGAGARMAANTGERERGDSGPQLLMLPTSDERERAWRIWVRAPPAPCLHAAGPLR